jgi:transposase
VRTRAGAAASPSSSKPDGTIRKHRDGINATINRGLSNGRHEGPNNKVRLIINRAYGFHSAEAALSLMLAADPSRSSCHTTPAAIHIHVNRA